MDDLNNHDCCIASCIQRLLPHSHHRRIPQPVQPTPKLNNFSMSAYLTRLNAVWFEGSMNNDQRECLTVFASVYLFYTRVLGRDVSVNRLAYGLATAYHETAYTMKPIEEYGKGAGRPYGEPDPTTGQVYYGRGLVQLTWLANYQKAQLAVINPTTLQADVPFVSKPELALDMFYAVQILISGMSEGWFTGKKFSDYLTDTKTDYVGARYIINGQDKAQPIAAYATEAEEAIKLAMGMGITRSTIQNGSRGGDVCEMQLMLGCDSDGIAGNNTISALSDFQRRNGLEPDGICGTESWAALDKEFNHL